MAKVKKSYATLTLEEKLEQALVADWEQSYKVPDNWCWVRLSSLLLEIKNGTTIKQDKSGNGYSVTRIESLQNQTIDFNRLGTIVDETKIKDTDWYEENDIVLSHINSAEHVGKTALITSNMLPLVHGMNLLRLRFCSLCNPKLFQYYTQSFLYKEKITSRMNMAVNQVSINQKQLGDIEYPLPPLAEQQRIVDRIERMFSKLDEVKENVQNVIDGFENRKSAILHKAFSGELTAKWRKENGISFESWENVVIDDVCVINPPKLNTKELDNSLEVSFIPMTAISEIYGEIITPQVRLLKDVKSGFTNFKEGDVVFAKITPCMENGKCAVVGKLVNDIGYGTTEFYVFRCGEKLFNRYLYHVLRHKSFRDRAKAEMTGAVGQQRVPKNFLQKYSLYLPSYSEQNEIVNLLDKFISKEQQAKEKAEEVLERIELIKKSILARAFRGELGTNNPDEESSIELLKTVLDEKKDGKTSSKPKSKRASIPAEIKAMLSNNLEKDILKLFYKADSNEVSIDDIMSVSSNKFEVMDALKALEEKKLVLKKANGIYKLAR